MEDSQPPRSSLPPLLDRKRKLDEREVELKEQEEKLKKLKETQKKELADLVDDALNRWRLSMLAAGDVTTEASPKARFMLRIQPLNHQNTSLHAALRTVCLSRDTRKAGETELDVPWSYEQYSFPYYNPFELYSERLESLMPPNADVPLLREANFRYALYLRNATFDQKELLRKANHLHSLSEHIFGDYTVFYGGVRCLASEPPTTRLEKMLADASTIDSQHIKIAKKDIELPINPNSELERLYELIYALYDMTPRGLASKTH